MLNIFELLFDKILHIAISTHALGRTTPIIPSHPKARPTLLSRTSSPRSRTEGPRPAVPRRPPLAPPYTTFSFLIPRSLSFLHMTWARGQTEVLLISVTSKVVGFSLFPAPIQLMIGVPDFSAFFTRASFPVTGSMASTT